MTSLGIPRRPDVAKILNHAEEDDDTTAVYDRWEYWPEKQKALALWERELRAVIAGKPSGYQKHPGQCRRDDRYATSPHACTEAGMTKKQTSEALRKTLLRRVRSRTQADRSAVIGRLEKPSC
jgi:hypothetical protein